MNFKHITEVSYTQVEHLLASGKFFNFTGQYEPERTYQLLDTFSDDSGAQVVVSQNEVISVLLFVKLLTQYGFYDKFYATGKHQLAETKTDYIHEDTISEIIDSPTLNEDSHSRNRETKFICNLGLILHSSVTEIAEFCNTFGLCIELADGGAMSLVPNH